MSSYKLTEIGSSEHPDESNSLQKSRGFRIKPGTGLVLIFLAIAIAVGVGLIVHFVENRKLECQYPDGHNTGSGEVEQQLGGRHCPTVTAQQCQTLLSTTPEVPTTIRSTAASSSAVKDVRLPVSFEPLLYEIEIQPEMYGTDPASFYFKGNVRISIHCREPASNVTLHVNKLNVSDVTFSPAERGGKSPKFTSLSKDKERQFLIVYLDGHTEKGSNYILEMNFRGDLKDDLAGFYLSTYTDKNVTKYMATTKFESTDARKAFPCFDEPALKARFQITVVRKKYMTSLSNMNRIRVDNRHGDYKADVYNTSVKMSTYLVAFVVGEIKHQERNTSRGIQYGAWSRASAEDQTTIALDIGVRTITQYENYFRVNFPLPKQDMIAIPDFASGAMENWGLITYRETAMLYTPGISAETNLQRVATVITHELSHQWFGDLVTMAWWDDLWLNEGFATFVEYLGTSFLYPDWNMFDQFTVLEIQDVFEFDSLVTSHPVYVPVRNPDEISEIFDKISYAKGAAIIRMMRFILGEETFRKGLTLYLTNNQYGNAVHDDLWSALSTQSTADGSDVNVKEIMDTWTLQMNYPVVMVTRNNGVIHIQQSRFLSNRNATDPGKYTSDFGYQWQIPFTYTTSKQPTFNVSRGDIVWLTGEQKDIPAPTVTSEVWVLANIQQYGFYRVNYDTDNWMALIEQLKSDHLKIQPINRGQIINDAWSLARGGYLETEIALHVLEYLDLELDYVPWVAAFRQLHYVNRMLGRTELFGNFQSFMKLKLEKPFKHYGMDDTNSSHIDSLARADITHSACSYGIQTCIREAKKLFSDWMDHPSTNLIDPDLRPTVYCTGVGEGGVEEWDFLYQQFKMATVVTEKVTISKALACARSTWILSRYLELALTPTEVRKQDATTILLEIASNPIGGPLTWDFIRNKWTYLRDVYGQGPFSFTKLIAGVTSSFNTEFQLSQLKDFLEKYPDMGTGTRAFKQAIEKTEINIRWMKENKPILAEWLRNVTKIAEDSEVKDVRLPRHLIPEHYDLTLKPDMYTGNPDTFTFEGHVTIDLQGHARGRNVTLHIKKLNITESSISFHRKGDTTSLYAGTRHEDKKRQFLILDLTADVMAGERYQLEMNFTGPLASDLTGLYLSTYERNNQTVYMVTSQLESTDARKAFPCFDEPNLKATFSVTLIRKNNLTSISNLPKKSETPMAGNFVADHFNNSAKMSTYLLAFIICDFQYRNQSSKRGVEYRAWARSESINQTKVALNAGTRLMDYYEDYFGINFPLPKQDMIAIPDFGAGAMENWGLITYRETAMLYEPGVSSVANKQRVTVVIAHELGHQWFGDLVTMKWWDDIWLNEGFATFVEYLGTDYVEPNLKMWDQFVIDLHGVFAIDSLVTSHPVYVPVKNPDEIEEIFDTISYEKGGAVIRMTRSFLGENTFKKGVQIYLRKKQYSNADHNDLWAALQEQADKDGVKVNVSSVLDTWLLQMNYPVVMVTRQANGTIHIEQSRHLKDPNATDPEKYKSKFGYVWKVPFTFTQQTTANFNASRNAITWLDQKAMNVPSSSVNSSEWFVGNIRQLGIYRVNYEVQNWRRLVEQLKINHKVIHVTNRAQIINDAFGLAISGDLSMDIALSSLEYIDKETDYIPWETATNELDYINSMLQGRSLYGVFKSFMNNKITPLYKRLGLRRSPANPLQSYLQSLAASKACFYGNKDCIQDANDMFSFFRNTKNNTIAPVLRNTVYCTAVRTGNQDTWDFVFDLYKTEKVASEKVRLLSALSCSQEPWIIRRLLETAMDMKVIRQQDVYKVFQNVAYGNPVGEMLLWNFVLSSWNDLTKTYGFGKIVRAMTYSFNTEYQLNQLIEFKSSHTDLGTGTRAIDQAIERTRANIRWMNSFYGNIKSWLSSTP